MYLAQKEVLAFSFPRRSLVGCAWNVVIGLGLACVVGVVRLSVSVTAHKWLSTAMCAIGDVGVDVGCRSLLSV